MDMAAFVLGILTGSALLTVIRSVDRTLRIRRAHQDSALLRDHEQHLQRMGWTRPELAPHANQLWP